jgi:guanylate kinase
MLRTVRKRKGSLFIVSAPSGAGKTSLCQKLTTVVPNIRHSVSYTTRSPRNGEVNDRDYTFVSETEFLGMAEHGDFAEWARVHGNLYGTSKKRLDELRKAGTDVILDIDTQGAGKIRTHYEDGVYIFILPPSMDALRERLEKRMSNSREEIDLRMKRASEEIKDYKSYDYVIVNSDFGEALDELKAIVLAENDRTNKIDPRWVEETFRI